MVIPGWNAGCYPLLLHSFYGSAQISVIFNFAQKACMDPSSVYTKPLRAFTRYNLNILASGNEEMSDGVFLTHAGGWRRCGVTQTSALSPIWRGNHTQPAGGRKRSLATTTQPDSFIWLSPLIGRVRLQEIILAAGLGWLLGLKCWALC